MRKEGKAGHVLCLRGGVRIHLLVVAVALVSYVDRTPCPCGVKASVFCIHCRKL